MLSGHWDGAMRPQTNTVDTASRTRYSEGAPRGAQIGGPECFVTIARQQTVGARPPQAKPEGCSAAWWWASRRVRRSRF